MGREDSAAELLELVRSAEQGAYVATTPSGNPLPVPGADAEEFVDVQDEAIEATPTLPHAIPVPGLPALAAPAPAPKRSTSPAVAIVTVVVLASAALALLAR